jgi:hypothetical protein
VFGTRLRKRAFSAGQKWTFDGQNGAERHPLNCACWERRLWYVAGFFAAPEQAAALPLFDNVGIESSEAMAVRKFALRQPIDALNKDDLTRHKRDRC